MPVESSLATVRFFAELIAQSRKYAPIQMADQEQSTAPPMNSCDDFDFQAP